MSTAFDGLTTAQIAALTTAQIAALTTADMAGLTTVQAPALTIADLNLLTTAEFAVITTSDVAVLTPSQVGGLSTAQLAALTTSQAGAMTAAQIAALSASPVYTATQQAAAQHNTVTRLAAPTNAFPTAIPSGTTWKSGVMPLLGVDSFEGRLVAFSAIACSLKSTQVVTVTIQRYLDAAGLLPVGAPGTLTATANTAGYASLTAVMPALYYDVQIANAATATAIIKNIGIGLQAQF
jgi:hypothetical protein